jgi:hypothetical protein
LQSISKKNYKNLSEKQKDVLHKVKISVWDIVKKSSGGHKDITNISGLNFYPNNMSKLTTDIWHALGKEMNDKHLKEG